MEPLINIIVTIAVIFFVLKRMQEVAKKGGDLTKPPIPRPMFPDEDEEMTSRREEMQPEEESRRAEMFPDEEETVSDDARSERVRRAQEQLRERNKKLEERRRYIERQRRIAEERFESAREAVTIREEYREPVATSTPRRATARPARAGQPGGTPIPAFTRSVVVQGLIMSEILGPPVSLRTQDRLF